ncbi:unnamed protein product [Prorocentrum cordatum]|uniref:EF-hand domain-containing protein n=1 Tax=Prorocentrum cordatum TaxID=2364126 RepID=A0ABN9X1I1_9DINO|nr:unnamed protein product [Polarella glacialis]
MAEPSGLRAALQEHEARPCQALAANQASLKQSFVGHSPQFGTVGLAEALSPSEVADERVWWSEALTAQVIRTTAAQTQQILSFVSEEIQKQTEVLQFFLAASTRSAAAEAPPGGEAHALSPRPRDGAPRGGLEALLEQEISERRASETGLRKVMEEQGAALEGMSRALAGLEALLRPPGGAPEAPPAAPPAAECVPDVGEASERSAPMKHEHVSMEWPGMELRKQCRRLCHSRQFVLFTVCMIVANSALLGFEANEAMTSPDLTLPDGLAYRIAHASFALVFVIELALRWFGDGGRDWGDIAEPFMEIHWMLAFFVKAAGELSASHSLSDQKIRREDFITLMKSKTNVKFLEENGLDLCFAGTGWLEQLFNIMDEDGNGDLDVSEFVNNLYDLKGPARALEQKLEHQKIMGMIDALRTDSMQASGALCAGTASTSLLSAIWNLSVERLHALFVVLFGCVTAVFEFGGFLLFASLALRVDLWFFLVPRAPAAAAARPASAGGAADGGASENLRNRVLRAATPQLGQRTGRASAQPALDARFAIAALDLRARILGVATPLRAEAGAARLRRDARSRSRPRLLLAAAGA